ncbi:DsbA family protein [Candidatus Uhrbacteria bacterium]|nr:DsbA family protein [Candidatus Uhrbacteria bacterium]
MKKHYVVFLIPVVLTLVVITGVTVAREKAANKQRHGYSSAETLKGESTQSAKQYEALIDNNMSPSSGPKDARVVVVEFLDFQCPYCQASHEPLARAMKRYQDSSVRFVFRQFPLTAIHAMAVPAAQAALCAHEQSKYLEMQDILMMRQDQIKQESFTPWAAEIGLNLAQFNTCLADKKYNSLIKKDLSDAQTLGIQGTPTWFINGERIVGQITYEELTSVIDDYLGRAPKQPAK